MASVSFDGPALPRRRVRLASAKRYFTVPSLNGEASILVSGTEECSSKTAQVARLPEKPTIRIRPGKGWAALNLRELWSYRDLLWILVERDIRLLYKQTALGITWVILQPLIAALILTIIFGWVARLPSDGAPYLLFVVSGMTVWTYFSQALQRAGNSVVYNAHLVSKVYFPRLLLPLVHILRALIDFIVVLLVLFVLMAVYRIPPTLRLFTIPVFVLFMMLTATGIALWFSALTVTVPGLQQRAALFSSDLDVRDSCRLPNQHGPRKVALAVRIEPCRRFH